MRISPTPRPLSHLAWLLPAAVIGCVGGPLTTSLAGPSPIAAPDAFACVRNQLKAENFTQSSYDADRLRVTAQRFDETQRRPDTQFRRMVDRLEVEVAPGTGGAVSNITIDASTFAELTTQRGPTEVQEKASAVARAAAQTILQKCSQPVDSLTVPG